MSGIILSVDIGTSSLKAAFIDFDGHLKAFSRISYTADLNCKNGINCAGAEEWERSFVLALDKLASISPGSKIEGVCISGNGPTLVPVTREGRALQPLFWHDGKTFLPPECGDALPGKKEYGETFPENKECGEGFPGNKAVPEGKKSAESKASGTGSFFLPHAAWLKKNSPGDYERISLFISSHEWLAHRLGAEALTVLPQASYEPYYWDDEQCRLFNLEREKFPPFIKMGAIMGKVSQEAALRLGGSGLKSGIPLIAGGPDFITALMGTGTWEPGDVCDRAGSSEGINVCSAVPVMAGGLRVLPHARKGFWNIGSVIPSSGRLFEWYRTAAGYEKKPYEDLLADLIPSPGDVEIFRNIEFLPPAGTESFHLNSSLPASCSSLEFGRSLLCAIGFTVRNAVEALRARGFPIKEMKVSGGQGKNPRWNQLKADIIGVPLMVPEIADGELAGNAVLAVSALDPCLNDMNAENTDSEEIRFSAAIERMIRIRDVYKPNAQTAAFWEDSFRQKII